MASELDILAERYVLETAIASGGMATVWRARDEVLARAVAVKILHAHLAEDPQFLERFRREALAAAGLTHPNIVSTYDTGQGEDESHFIVMEFCGGGTLADLLEREDPFDDNRLCWVATHICDALDYAHSQGVIHRDVKPANVLLTQDSTIKVGDFGIAKAAPSGDITTTGSILGTVTYLSPEQARGDEPDARSDIYSLGVVLYECAVGRPPFAAPTEIATAMKHVKEPPPRPRSMRAGISRPVENVILTALAKDPNDRFSSAGEMRTALERATGSSGATTIMRPATRSQPTRTSLDPNRELRWLWPVIALIGLAALLIIFVPRLIDESSRGGGPPPGGEGTGDGASVEIVSANDFDPTTSGGDGSEHPGEVNLAFDGNTGTYWTTENYSTFRQSKEGVGLVFEVGGEVAGLELTTATPGFTFEVRAAESRGASVDDFTLIEEATAGSPIQLTFDEPAAQRYWALWITSMPGGDSGSVQIGEVRFISP